MQKDDREGNEPLFRVEKRCLRDNRSPEENKHPPAEDKRMLKCVLKEIIRFSLIVEREEFIADEVQKLDILVNVIG